MAYLCRTTMVNPQQAVCTAPPSGGTGIPKDPFPTPSDIWTLPLGLALAPQTLGLLLQSKTEKIAQCGLLQCQFHSLNRSYIWVPAQGACCKSWPPRCLWQGLLHVRKNILQEQVDSGGGERVGEWKLKEQEVFFLFFSKKYLSSASTKCHSSLGYSEQQRQLPKIASALPN